MLTNKDIESLEMFLEFNSQDYNEIIKMSGLDKSVDFIEADFSRMMLTDIDFSGFNLKGADFSDSILLGANFTDALVEGANFTNTNLMRANFDGASIDEATIFNNSYLNDVSGLGESDINEKVEKTCSMLFIEDELESMISVIQGLVETFPYVNIDFVGSEHDGVEKLKTAPYIFAIIDAKIPETDANNAHDLLGQRISEQLSSGEIKALNKEMKHVILTEHKKVVIDSSDVVNSDDLLAVVEKSDPPAVFKKHIIDNVYKGYLDCVST